MTDAISGTSFLAGAQGVGLPQPGEFRQAILDSASQALGMTTQDIQTALQGGQSLADLAQQKGVSSDDLVTAIAGGLQQLAGSDATQVAQKIASHKGGFGGHRHHHHAAGGSAPNASSASSSPFQVLSQTLGMSRDELLSRLESGTSLPDLLQQQGVSADSLPGLLDTTA